MKIGVVGNYGNNNEGDEAILAGILIQLEATFQIKREDIIVFSNDTQQTYQRYGVHAVKLYHKRRTAPTTLVQTMIRNKPVVEKLDLLIIGGGGILMDLYLHSLVLFPMYGWLAKLAKTPAVIYGAGAGPITTKKGRLLLRSLTDIAELITVRDPESKELLASIGVKKPIHVIGDPAFQLKSQEAKPKDSGVLQIGVTAVPYYHGSYWPKNDKQKYENYITGMARNLDQLLWENERATVNFFSTKHPYDTEVTKEIKALMVHKDRCVLYDKRLRHPEIVRLSSEMDLIIGTRLHSLIMALVAKKPVIAVSYHDKVEDFMNLIDCGEETIRIEQLHQQEEFFAAVYREMKTDWQGTMGRFAAISDEMKSRSDRGMELIKEVYKA